MHQNNRNYHIIEAGEPTGGGKKHSFFRLHWFLTFCVLFVLCAVALVVSDGGLIEKTKRLIGSMGEDAVVEMAPAVSQQNAWELAQEDHEALEPVIKKLFEPGFEYKTHMYSEKESAVLRGRHPALAEKKAYFTRIEKTYFYVSTDGLRIYSCEIDGELRADKRLREAKEAKQLADAAQQTEKSASNSDGSGIVIYSPSSLSGDSLNNLTEDPKMKGIFRDADGTWKNY